MADYTELFEQRGSSYDRAMQAFPQARRAEFEQLLAPLDLSTAKRIGDVPAGGGYLRAYIPNHCEWCRHEPCSDFTTHAGQDAPAAGKPLFPFPWRDGSIDAVVSLAGVHHLEDKPAFWREAWRVTPEGGDFVLSDVADGHRVAHFLDDFVGAHNSTGHEGIFLDDATAGELADCGWTIVDDAVRDFTWDFDCRGDMVAFTRRLFDIGEVPDALIEDAIDIRLGVDERGGGGIGMRWALRTIHCRKDG